MKTRSQRNSNRFVSKLEKAASGVAVAWAVLAPGSAQASTRAWIDTTAKAEIASNPFLLGGSNTSAASGIITVSPSLEYSDGVKTIGLSGQISHSEFARRYRSNDSFAVSANLNQKISPRLSYFANAGIDSAIVGANDVLKFGAKPGNGNAIPPIPTDIALNGLRQRRQSLNGAVGLDYTANARDSLQTQGGFSMVRYPSGSTASEYDSANGSIGYSRVLNSRTSLGVTVGVSRADYLRTPLGDATTFSPQFTFTTKFGASWSFSASAGISHSTINGLTGKFSQDSASGRLSLCNTASRGKFCVYGSRSVQPSSFGGTVRPQTSLGASYDMRLDARSSISASADFSRSGQVTQGNIVTGRSLDYGSASLTYSRRISQRLQGTLSAAYSDSYRDTTKRKANTSLSLGISYAFGDMR